MDASQGVEAQTLANTYLALDHHLEIIPVINKIDLPSAEIPRIKDQIENIIGLDASGAILASAKEGIGTEEILEAIVHRLPAAQGRIRQAAESADLRLLVRRLSRRHRAGARHRRHRAQGDEDPAYGRRSSRSRSSRSA